jgi:hypothetical protein
VSARSFAHTARATKGGFTRQKNGGAARSACPKARSVPRALQTQDDHRGFARHRPDDVNSKTWPAGFSADLVMQSLCGCLPQVDVSPPQVARLHQPGGRRGPCAGDGSIIHSWSTACCCPMTAPATRTQLTSASASPPAPGLVAFGRHRRDTAGHAGSVGFRARCSTA